MSKHVINVYKCHLDGRGKGKQHHSRTQGQQYPLEDPSSWHNCCCQDSGNPLVILKIHLKRVSHWVTLVRDLFRSAGEQWCGSEVQTSRIEIELRMSTQRSLYMLLHHQHVIILALFFQNCKMLYLLWNDLQFSAAFLSVSTCCGPSCLDFKCKSFS